MTARLAIVVTTVAFTGCASVLNESTHPIKVETKSQAGDLVAGAECKTADVFVLNGSEPTIRPMTAAPVKDDQIEYRLPPLTATLFVCRP